MKKSPLVKYHEIRKKRPGIPIQLAVKMALEPSQKKPRSEKTLSRVEEAIERAWLANRD